MVLPGRVALAFGVLMAVLLARIIVLKSWQQQALGMTVLVLPLSWKWSIEGAVDLTFPSEFLIITMALVVLWELAVMARWQIVRNHPWPALWIITFLLPLVQSTMPVTSLKFTVLNALMVGVFYYGILLFAVDQFRFYLRLFALALVPVVFWGMYNFYRYDFNPITITGIFQPFFYSSTFLGAVCAMGMGYAVGRSSKGWYYLALAALAFAVVVLSESRAALLSTVLVFASLPLYGLRRWARLAVPVVLLVGGYGVVGPDALREAFAYNKVESHDPTANVFEETLSVTNVETDVSNKERLNRWVSALKMFRERPHWGFGPGTYQFAYIPFQEEGLKNRLSVRNPDNPPPGSGGSAHSEVLLQLSENGWPTTVVFVVMMGVWVRRGLLFPRNWRDPKVAFFLAMVTYIFHMNVNNFLNQPAFAFLFWGFGAMLSVSSKELAEKNE
jgi:O-antigen ligase